MGLSLRSIGKRIEGLGAQANWFDNGKTYNTVLQNRAPVPNTPSFTKRYSPANIFGGIGQGVHKTVSENIVQPALNTVRAPLDLSRIAAAGITRNPLAYRNANDALTQHSLGSFIGPLASYAYREGVNLGANRILNNPNTSPSIKQAQLREAVNPAYHQIGVDLGDRGLRSTLKEAANFAQAVSTPVLLKGGIVKGKAPSVNPKLVINNSIRAGRKVAPKALAENNARVTAYDDQYKQLQKAYDNAPNPTAKKQISMALSNNRQARSETIKTIKEGGYIGRGNDNPLPSPPGRPKKASTPINSATEAGQGRGFPSYEEFSKIIPAEPGIKVGGAISTATRKGKTRLPKQPNIPTSDNPIKVELSNPKPSEYGAAITDRQRVQSSISQAATIAQHSLRRLSKADRQLFPHARENTKLIAKAENPEKMKQAISNFKQLTNTAHAYDIAAGGKTPHISGYYRHVWDLSKPEDAARFEAIAQKKGFTKDPFSYQGFNNQPRVFKTIAEGERAGFKLLNKDPLQEVQDYANKASGIVGNQALARGVQLADAARGPEAALTKKFELSPGNYIDISPEAAAKLRGIERLAPSSKPLVRGVAKGLRTTNAAVKSTVLSLGQFHTINIGALRAAPTLIAKGHPVAAAKGLYRMFRSAFGNAYADRVIGTALKDGTVDKAAKIGMPYGGGGYNIEGTFLKSGVGSKTVFGKQIPMMHDQVARSIIRDLEKKGVALDSAEAREAGLAGANLMGELNRELQNIPPRVRQSMTDLMLAGQFTPSKFIQAKRAVTKGGVAGSYARANVAANVAASTAIIAGVGYALNQQSDNIKDMLLRAILDPAVPTPLKDSKGNTVKLRLPGTDTSDIAKLLGLKLVRNASGHLGVSWNPHNLPQTVEDFGRARLSPGGSAAVKVATNTTFAGKPLYDPNAPAGTKAIQATTSILTGDLPIGLQGLPQTTAIKSQLPGSIKEVMEAQTPGTNPLIKSIGSSFGLTPSTDATVGKALETSRYFDNLTKAGKGLNSQESAALKLYAGSKKNSVTGRYDVQPSVDDQRAKATALLQNPKVIDHLITLNKSLAKEGSKIDPLWQESKDKIASYLQYQAMPPGGADRSYWHSQNDNWYQPLTKERSAFFDSLPPGDPNKPHIPIEFPSASQTVSSKMDTYFAIKDNAQAAKYIASNPDLQQQFDKQADYNNSMRQAQGYGELDSFPKASPQVQRIIDVYNSLPKNDGPKGGNKTRSLWIQAHPNEYTAMTRYFTQASLYNLQKAAGQAQFKDSGFSQKGLKAIYNLGQYDIGKYTDANGNTFYALGGGDNSQGSGGYTAKPNSKYSYSVSLIAGGKARKPTIRVRQAAIGRGRKTASARPKVTLKKSLV